jgi:hypothetical protein
MVATSVVDTVLGRLWIISHGNDFDARVIEQEAEWAAAECQLPPGTYLNGWSLELHPELIRANGSPTGWAKGTVYYKSKRIVVICGYRSYAGLVTTYATPGLISHEIQHALLCIPNDAI